MLGFAVVLLVGELGLLVVSSCGKAWREAHLAKEEQIRAAKKLGQ
jgi:hypothetical protein